MKAVGKVAGCSCLQGELKPQSGRYITAQGSALGDGGTNVTALKGRHKMERSRRPVGPSPALVPDRTSFDGPLRWHRRKVGDSAVLLQEPWQFFDGKPLERGWCFVLLTFHVWGYQDYAGTGLQVMAAGEE